MGLKKLRKKLEKSLVRKDKGINFALSNFGT